MYLFFITRVLGLLLASTAGGPRVFLGSNPFFNLSGFERTSKRPLHYVSLDLAHLDGVLTKVHQYPEGCTLDHHV